MRKKYYYICEDCKEKHSRKKDKKPNPDTGKLLCQKCSCKYTNTRDSKRKKSSDTSKIRWKNGDFEHLREQYSEQLTTLNKTVIKDINLNKTDKEKVLIKMKKRNTFYSKSKKERDEINYRRTSAFREWNKQSHDLREKFLDTLSKEEAIKLREYAYITNENWNLIRKKIIEKANYKCQLCGKNKTLDVHHSIPFVIRQENKDLIALCRSCHMIVEMKFRKEYNKTENSLQSKVYSLEGTDMEGYSISEAAERLGISRQTIYNWIKEEKIDFFIQKNRKKIKSETIKNLIEQYNYGN